MPFGDAIKEFPTSCGEVAWPAVGQIQKLLKLFRERKWPVLYPHISPKQSFDYGRIAEQDLALMTVAAKGYDFVAEIAPQEAIFPPRKSIPVRSSPRHSRVT